MSKKQNSKQRSVGVMDKAIGLKIRTARMDAQLSQAELGEKLGVSFQQVQKYEKGINRLSSVRLTQIVETLGKPMSYFIEEPSYKPNSSGEKIAKFVASRVGHQLCEAAVNLSPKVQQSLIDFARSVGNSKAA
jgi:transcriptional regulator with XRE-family HTH domain